MSRYLTSFLNVLILCGIVFLISANYVHDAHLIGFVMIGLGILCLLFLKFFRITIKATIPDILFGIIDNGILAIFAIFGAYFAGVIGAIIGGAVGNAITDGIAGLFEGYWAETYKAGKRTVLGSSVGKMAGCLLGAGVVLSIASLI